MELRDKDIAVIGLSGAFAKANNIDEFKNIIFDGERSFTWFSDEELLKEGVENELLHNPNFKKVSGFMPDADMFDAAFFGITPREAELMDPQYRLLLQCAYHTLEDSGYSNKLDTYKCGIFATSGMQLYSGKNLNTYFKVNIEHQDSIISTTDAIKLKILNEKDYLPTQVAYKLNLRGPALAISTACSSSLVAVNYAVQSIRNGECDIALAGGCSIHAPVKNGYIYTEGGIYSSKGACNPFSDDADGIIGGNGVGLVLLKSLKKAIEDGDNIHAVIRGVATNNDGSGKISFTAPSIEGQEENIRRSLIDAGINASSIGYVEAHGTGTKMGDPIEIKALTNAFGAQTKKRQFASIGSVKANIGHLDASSGIASLIKTILILKEQKIPPLVGYNNHNPLIKFESTPFYVTREIKVWDDESEERNCLVASLGAGGTNAHIVLTEWVSEKNNTKISDPNITSNLYLSAKNKAALHDFVKNYITYLERTEDDFLSICKTSALRRNHFNHRLFFNANSNSDLRNKLLNFLEDSKLDSEYPNCIQNNKRKTVLLFTGQGAQILGMGKMLYNYYPLFRKTLDEIDSLFYKHKGYSLLDIMFQGTEKQLNNTENTQPVLFAFEYACFKLWESLGIKPDIVLGHSIGEYVAACVSGVFSWQDALFLVIKRGELMGKLPDHGSMLSVNADRQILETIKRDLKLNFDFAAENSQEDFVVAGQKSELDVLYGWCKENKIKTSVLNVSHAFHSRLMNPILDEMLIYLKQIKYNLPRIKIISNVTGEAISSEMSTAEYWIKHIVSEVKFFKSINYLQQRENCLFLEIGPKPILSSLVQHSFQDAKVIALKGKNEQIEFQNAVGNLFLEGVNLNFDLMFDKLQDSNTSLPNYPFQKERYWLSAKVDRKFSTSTDSQISNKIFIPRWIKSSFLHEKNSNADIAKTLIISNSSNKLVRNCLLSIEKSVYQKLSSIYDQSLGKFDHHFIHLLNSEISNIVYIPEEGDRLDKTTFDLVVFLRELENSLKKSPVDFHLVHTNKTSTQISELNNASIGEVLVGVAKTARYELNNLNIYVSELGGLDIENEIKNFSVSLNTNRIFQLRFAGTDTYQQKLEAAHYFNNVNWFKGKQTILITGGLGELGLFFAEKLAYESIPHLILVGRSPVSPEISARIRKIEQNYPTKISILSCDITDSEKFKNQLYELLGSKGKIDCIFHMAGTLLDAAINNLNINDIKKSFLPKVIGLNTTLQVCADYKFENVVVFSSVASLFGSAGQANYAAANSFLNYVAQNLSVDKIKFQSICWGPWDEIGMAANQKAASNIKSHGIIAISKEEAFELTSKALSTNEPLILVNELSEEIQSNINDLDTGEIALRFWNKNQNNKSKDETFISHLNLVSSSEQLELITDKIINTIKDVTGMSLTYQPVPTDSFHDLGIDSLSILQLKNILNKLFQLSLSASDFYSFSNPVLMAGHIQLKMQGGDTKEEKVRFEDKERQDLLNLLERELLD